MDKPMLVEPPSTTTGEDQSTIADRIVHPESELSEVFAGLTRQLRRKYPIDKGVLVLREDDGKRLSAITTWSQGNVRDGLKLNLPAETSLFEKVAECGHVYTEDFCESFSGNFFERKLLLDDDSRCFAIQPLKFEGRVMGLMGFSSRRSSAFTMMEEGALDEIAGKFGEIIEDTLNRR